MATEPCIFQGKERKHGNKQLKERKERSSACAAWLTAVASPDCKGCSPRDACTVPACHSEASCDAGCSRTTACSTQACRLVADSSSATCVITDTGRNDPAEPFNYPMKKPKSFCSRRGTRLALGDKAPDACIATRSISTSWGWRKHRNSQCVWQHIPELGDEHRSCPAVVSRGSTVPQHWYVGRIPRPTPSCHALGAHCCTACAECRRALSRHQSLIFGIFI